MKLSQTVRPISYFKAHASDMIRHLSESHGAYVITQRGEAKAVVQDVVAYEKTQESLAFLKILAQSRKSLSAGHYKPLHKAFKDIKKGARFRA